MSNSIIVLNNTPLTPAQLLEQRAKTLAGIQSQAFQQVSLAFKQTADFIWGNPEQAQAKFTAFTNAGFKATDLFVNAEIYINMVTALTGVAPASPVPAGYSYTLNADGTVTVIPPASLPAAGKPAPSAKPAVTPVAPVTPAGKPAVAPAKQSGAVGTVQPPVTTPTSSKPLVFAPNEGAKIVKPAPVAPAHLTVGQSADLSKVVDPKLIQLGNSLEHKLPPAPAPADGIQGK